MLAAAWQLCDDPAEMLDFLRDRADDRRLRLFGVACCRQNAELFPEGWHRDGIAFAERLADGCASEPDRAAAADALHALWCERDFEDDGVLFPQIEMLFELHQRQCSPVALRYYGWELARAVGHGPTGFDGLSLELEAEQADIIRDLFGDPFRPVALAPAWRTPTAVGVARAIYDGRTFHDLPVLADALQDAGCDAAEVLAHCRAGGVHVRGCWVVDLVLGKR